MKPQLPINKAVSDAALLHITTETPFNKRHDCWFCGEPNQYVFTCLNAFTSQGYTTQAVTELSLPSCKECYLVANKSITKATHEEAHYSIWTIKLEVKRYLIQHYHKDLAIGVNWTKTELEESEFEQGNFAGFQRSAWLMYEIAKARVNYDSWPLFLNGVKVLDDYQERSFNFDGVVFPDIEQAIMHYANTMSLNYNFFSTVLELFGANQFAKVVRFCRLLVAANDVEKQQALRQLRKELS